MTVEQWAAVVSGEDAAIYAYSIAGPRANASSAALNGLAAHRSHRDRAASIVSAQSGTPPAPHSAYDLPLIPTSPGAARRLMAQVDNRLVGLYADAAEGSTGAQRRWAARMAVEYATRAVSWGAQPQAFPT